MVNDKFKAREKVLVLDSYFTFIKNKSNSANLSRVSSRDYWWTSDLFEPNFAPYYEGIITAKSKGSYYGVSFVDPWGITQNLVLSEEAIIKYDTNLVLLYA